MNKQIHGKTMVSTSTRRLDAEARRLASRLGATTLEPIASGTEAHVYGLDASRVLKLYPSEDPLARIALLHDFYERASTANVGFTIPRIREYGESNALAYSIEDRLDGTPMADLPGFIQKPQMAEIYIRTVLEVRRVIVSPPYGRCKLFDDDGSSDSWSEYIHGELDRKRRRLQVSLPTNVVSRLGPIDALAEYFRQGAYQGRDLLIHGDFHPGNVLVVEGSRVGAVVDFGTFTMFGDPLYDVAMACGFFSMYEPDQVTTRERILTRLFEIDRDLDQARARAYLLAAAVLTCDLYPDDDRPVHETGHFQWALSVLDDAGMWEGVAG